MIPEGSFSSVHVHVLLERGMLPLQFFICRNRQSFAYIFRQFLRSIRPRIAGARCSLSRPECRGSGACRDSGTGRRCSDLSMCACVCVHVCVSVCRCAWVWDVEPMFLSIITKLG